jgi:DNA adenine methylase
MIDRPVLRYHGGKYRLAEWVISHFPPHSCYVEPYAGAASVLMQKPRSPAECMNDLDDKIVSVFRVLRDPVTADALRRRLELTPFARTEFNAAYEPETGDPVEDAARLITISFMGQGSQGTTRNYRTGFRCALRNRDNNGLPSHEWAAYPASIPAFVERLQGVAIENTDALKVIRRLDSPDTLIYADPPYVTATRGRSYAKHGYRHEMTDADHEELAQALRAAQGMVVLSGYPSALYDRLYGDWISISVDAMADRGKEVTEVVWLNEACIKAQRQHRLIA